MWAIYSLALSQSIATSALIRIVAVMPFPCLAASFTTLLIASLTCARVTAAVFLPLLPTVVFWAPSSFHSSDNNTVYKIFLQERIYCYNWQYSNHKSSHSNVFRVNAAGYPDFH